MFGISMGRMGSTGANPYAMALMIDGQPVLIDGLPIIFS